MPFTAVAAARHGFALVRRLGGFPAVARHAGCLALYLARGLAGLRHGNDRPVAELYGGWGREGREERGRSSVQACGPTVTFNLLRPDGSHVGYGEVRRT